MCRSRPSCRRPRQASRPEEARAPGRPVAPPPGRATHRRRQLRRRPGRPSASRPRRSHRRRLRPHPPRPHPRRPRPSPARPSAPSPSAAVTPHPSSDRYALLAPCPDRADCYVYTIRAGDNLFSIANYFGVQLADVYRLNPWARTSGLHAGLELRLPPPYPLRRRRGEPRPRVVGSAQRAVGCTDRGGAERIRRAALAASADGTPRWTVCAPPVDLRVESGSQDRAPLTDRARSDSPPCIAAPVDRHDDGVLRCRPVDAGSACTVRLPKRHRGPARVCAIRVDVGHPRG